MMTTKRLSYEATAFCLNKLCCVLALTGLLPFNLERNIIFYAAGLFDLVKYRDIISLKLFFEKFVSV